MLALEIEKWKCDAQSDDDQAVVNWRTPSLCASSRHMRARSQSTFLAIGALFLSAACVSAQSPRDPPFAGRPANFSQLTGRFTIATTIEPTVAIVEDPITLKELAEEFGVSRERVRQIGVCAFEKVQKAVKNRVAAMGTPAPLTMH